jgi:hypothetical protein
MEKLYIEIELLDGSKIDVELDINSLGNPEQYSEEEMDNEVKELVKEQYPEYNNKIVRIYC